MTHFLPGHQVTLLRNGTEFFPALEAAIDAAQQEVLLETYIFEPDAIGQRIAEALKRAARRGAHVHVLVDGFGCKDMPQAFIDDMEAAGVDVLFFRPRVSPWTLKRNRLRRLHRKLAVVDGHVGFVGGINIIDDLNTPGHIPPRVDYAAQVEGPVVTAMHATMRRMWRRVAWAALRPMHMDKRHDLPGTVGDMRAAFVKRDNALHRRAIERAYLNAIRLANEEIVIANAYFLPGRRFRQALLLASRRGVRVVLLLQARVEYVLVDYATRALYGQLLSGGIEIHEYHASFMHSKVAVIDRRWATVGSSNIDPFSLLLSNEANIVVSDTRFAGELRDDMQYSIDTRSHRIHQDDWKRAPLLRRILAWIAYGAVRFLLGIIGYSKVH
jgi:cardiolipin synthase